jgi:predicted DNA-binding antitoxin AbrB/MazE fold protein
MSLEVEAIYERGVLKLDKPLPLGDRQRVMVTVKPVPALAKLWEHLDLRPKLRTELHVHRGMEWREFNEGECVSDSPRAGFRPGFSRVGPTPQSFTAPPVEYLNVDPKNLRGRAIDYDWDRPKMITNAARIRRGAWRLAAFVDRAGNLCSQRFHAMWPTGARLPLECLAAILNGPVANAFVAAREPGREIHIKTLYDIPLPVLSTDDQLRVVQLVRDYTARLSQPRDGIPVAEEELRSILLNIDAMILGGYDLPPELERMLLDFFDGSPRPVPFEFTAYPIAAFSRVRVLGANGDSERAWDAFNDRRAFLIDKELSEGLSDEEAAELQRLQDAADRYLDTVSPIQLEDLSWLEARVRNG